MRNIEIDESWKDETLGYLARIQSSSELDSDLDAVLKKNWLGMYFPGPEVSKASNLAIRLAVYANSLFYVTYETIAEIKSLWSKGKFVLVPLSVRFSYECWAAVHYAKKILDRLIAEENLEREEARANRLNFGARSNVQLFDGTDTTETSINVLTFIQNLSEIDEPEEAYNFLSEACHPNMIQSSYFYMAGPPLSNWSNEQFSEHAHELLEKTVSIIESTCSGIQNDVYEIHMAAKSYVNEKR